MPLMGPPARPPDVIELPIFVLGFSPNLKFFGILLGLEYYCSCIYVPPFEPYSLIGPSSPWLRVLVDYYYAYIRLPYD